MVAETVTVDNFCRAETDRMLKGYVDMGALGTFFHIRQPTPIDKQRVIRMNRDTLYSFGIFDLDAGPVTIVKPDSKGRFQSMQVITQDHYTPAVYYEPGEYTLSKEQIDTRYVLALIRTYANASNQEDIKVANSLQDELVVKKQDGGIGVFETPVWDLQSLKRVRDAINVLAGTKKDCSGMFGDKKNVDTLSHLLGTAYGWGGNPDEDATYFNVVPKENDGTTPYTLTVAEVPVDGFSSITVYNKDGFMEKNDLDAYSVNIKRATKNPDGTTTIHFGGDPSNTNYPPITVGWNYIVRLYEPRKEVLDGSWTFPAPTPVE